MRKAGLLTVAVLAFAMAFGTAIAAPTLDEWVKQNTVSGESTLCARKVDGDLFVVARAGENRLRLGTRLDMSGYPLSQGFSIAWLITDENGASLSSKKVRPISIRQKYVRHAGKIYADMVEYQTLSRSNPKELKLEVKIGKCAVWNRETDSCGSAGKSYMVEVCDVTL